MILFTLSLDSLFTLKARIGCLIKVTEIVGFMVKALTENIDNQQATGTYQAQTHCNRNLYLKYLLNLITTKSEEAAPMFVKTSHNFILLC